MPGVGVASWLVAVPWGDGKSLSNLVVETFAVSVWAILIAYLGMFVFDRAMSPRSLQKSILGTFFLVIIVAFSLILFVPSLPE